MRYTYSYFIQSSFKHFFLQNNVYSIIMGRFWVISQNMWNVRAIEIKKSTGNKTVTYSHLIYPLRASWHIRPCCNGSTISVSAFCYWFAQQIHPSFDRINLLIYLNVDFGRSVFSFILDVISLQWFMIWCFTIMANPVISRFNQRINAYKHKTKHSFSIFEDYPYSCIK